MKVHTLMTLVLWLASLEFLSWPCAPLGGWR